jgi:ankyrin repeat protein
MKRIILVLFLLFQYLNSYSQAIFDAIENKNYKEIEAIVTQNIEIDQPNSDGITPLWKATLAKDTVAMKILLDNKANPNAPTKGGATPIFIPTNNGNLDLIKILIRYGADVNYSNNEYKLTPLRNAARNGYLEVVRFLVEKGAIIDARAADNATALIASCGRGHIECVRFLIQNGANINVKDKDGDTPLINACANGRFEVVKLLMEKGADKNITDNKGLSAKDIASKYGFPKIAEFLN